MTHRKLLLSRDQLKGARDLAAETTKRGGSTPRPYNEGEQKHTQEKLVALLEEKAAILQRLNKQAEAKQAAEQKIEEEAKAVLAKAKEQLAEEQEKDKIAQAEGRARYNTVLGKGRR